MQLRMLQEKDAAGMLEWMHDGELVQFMSKNFSEKTIEDCKKFIKKSSEMENDMSLAVVNEADEYMGTVSLKYIDKKRKCAEFAIAMRRCAQGAGYAAYGMKGILQMGTDRLGLETIYWCVSKENKRAVRFYEKNGYRRVSQEYIKNTRGVFCSPSEELLWYLADMEAIR